MSRCLQEAVLCLIWFGYSPERILLDNRIHVALRDFAWNNYAFVQRAWADLQED